MNLNTICQKILNYKVEEETEDYEVSDFFDEIGEDILKLNTLTDIQKGKLLKSLFDFIKNQDSEMDENFSFIHLIESIDKPNYELYNAELLKFNKENGTIISTLLLNRHINSLSGDEWKKCIEILKSISDNNDYTEYVREEALDYYEHQMEK
ncbi:hypothetical protein [Aquimarina sp. LLG6339-5]|uniref:hypothetical protein n=1 Tax=Aquimarina sp. LLG6339-5 TaxID=3160830 RepID=UPI003863AF7C